MFNHDNYEKSGLNHAIAVLDSLNNDGLVNQFELLTTLAEKYENRVLIAWVDGIFNKNKLSLLGLSQDPM